jgi:hypothetical protein
MKATILNVSLGEPLPSRWELLLMYEGYSVISASHWKGFEQACRQNAGGIDLILLGQSLPPSLKRDMAAYSARHCPQTKVAELYIQAATTSVSYSYRETPNVDDFLDFIKKTLNHESTLEVATEHTGHRNKPRKRARH